MSSPSSGARGAPLGVRGSSRTIEQQARRRMSSSCKAWAMILSVAAAGAAFGSVYWADWSHSHKTVVFEDEKAWTLRVDSSFSFSPFRTHQSISPEIGPRLYSVDEYGWCDGNAPGMSPETQAGLCQHYKTVQYLTWSFLALTTLMVLASIMPWPSASGGKMRRFGLLGILAAGAAGAGLALLYFWLQLVSVVQRWFNEYYVEVNNMHLEVGRGWMLAAGASAGAALLLVVAVGALCCGHDHEGVYDGVEHEGAAAERFGDREMVDMTALSFYDFDK